MAGVSIGGGIVGIVIIGFMALLPLKLLHIRNNLVDYFDTRHDRAMSIRAGRHWQRVFDKDGTVKGYAKYTGNPIYDKIARYQTDRLVSDLEGRGLKVDWNQQTGHINAINGEALDGTKVSDRRSLIRQEMKRIYPEKGVIRRGIRARKVYRAYGIRLRFFENTRESVADRRLAFRKKVRERLFGDAGNKLDGSFAKTNPDGTDATNDLSPDINEAANKLRDDLIADPNKTANINLKDISPGGAEVTLNSLTAGTKAGVKAAAFGIVAIADIACEAKAYLQAIQVGGRVLRAAPLARHAGMIVTAADEIKDGKVANTGEINLLMQKMDGFETSGAWQNITGNDQAKPATGEKYRVDGGKVGYLLHLDNQLNVVGKACKNLAVKIGLGVGSLIVAVFTGGGSRIGEVAVAIAQASAISIALDLLRPMVIHMVAGTVLTGDETPEEMGDAMVAGYDVISNANARAQGGRILEPQEIAQINRSVALEQAEEYRAQPLVWRWFGVDNPRSFTARFAIWMPVTTSSAASKFNGVVATLNPLNNYERSSRIAGLFKRMTTPSFAAAGESMFGVDQYGLTDAELESHTDILNLEEEVLNDKGEYDKFVTECLDPDTSNPELYFDKASKCNSKDAKYSKFRLYYYDLGIMEGISAYVTDDNEWGVSSGTTLGPLPIAQPLSGERKAWNEELLKNPLYHGNPLADTDINSGTARDSVVWLMLQVVRSGFELTPSVIRTGHKPGSLHEKGLAVDIKGPAGNDYDNPASRRLYEFLFQSRQTLRIDELIFYPVDGASPCLDKGNPTPCITTFKLTTGNDSTDHKDHIHVGTFQ